MPNIPQKYVCGVIPPHILTRVAEHTSNEASGTARATLEHMRELATGRAATLLYTTHRSCGHGRLTAETSQRLHR